jgi:hypothetical protein
MHAAGCFVRYVPLKNVNPSFADPANEGRAQCLGYNSWRYVVIGISLYFLSILYGYYRAWRKTKVTTVIAHPERNVPSHANLTIRRRRNPIREALIELPIRPMAVDQRPQTQSNAMAPVHNHISSIRSILFDSYSMCGRLDE